MTKCPKTPKWKGSEFTSWPNLDFRHQSLVSLSRQSFRYKKVKLINHETFIFCQYNLQQMICLICYAKIKFPKLFIPKELVILKVYFWFQINPVILIKTEGLTLKKEFLGDNLLRIEIIRKTLRINFRKNVNNVKNSWKFGPSKVFSFWFSYSCSFFTKI